MADAKKKQRDIKPAVTATPDKLLRPFHPDFVKDVKARWKTQMPGKNAESAAFFALANAVTKSLEILQTETLKPLGYSLIEYQVIATVYFGAAHDEGISPTDLNVSLRQTSAGITQILTRLEKAGIIERHPNPHDRRSISIRLTISGCEVAQKICETMSEMQSQRLARLNAGQRAMVAEALQLLVTIAR